MLLFPGERVRTELERAIFARPGSHPFRFRHGHVRTANAFPTLFAGVRDADDDGIGERRRTVTVEYYGVGLAAIDYRFDASDGGGVPGPNAADVVGDMGRGDEATGVVGAVDAGAFAFAKDGIGEDGAFRVLGDDDGFLFRIFNDTVTKSACGVVGDVDAGAFGAVKFAIDEGGVGVSGEARAVVFTGDVAVSKGGFGFVGDDEAVASSTSKRATFH